MSSHEQPQQPKELPLSHAEDAVPAGSGTNVPAAGETAQRIEPIIRTEFVYADPEQSVVTFPTFNSTGEASAMFTSGPGSGNTAYGAFVPRADRPAAFNALLEPAFRETTDRSERFVHDHLTDGRLHTKDSVIFLSARPTPEEPNKDIVVVTRDMLDHPEKYPGVVEKEAHEPEPGVRGQFLITEEHDLVLRGHPADCPMLLGEIPGHGIFLAHLGRPEVNLRVLERGLAVITERYGVQPNDLRVAITPGIQAQYYTIQKADQAAKGILDLPYWGQYAHDAGDAYEVDILGKVLDVLQAADIQQIEAYGRSDEVDAYVQPWGISDRKAKESGPKPTFTPEEIERPEEHVTSITEKRDNLHKWGRIDVGVVRIRK